MQGEECTVWRDGGNMEAVTGEEDGEGLLECISKSKVSPWRWRCPGLADVPKRCPDCWWVWNQVRWNAAALLVLDIFRSHSSKRDVINLLRETFCYIVPPVFRRQRHFCQLVVSYLILYWAQRGRGPFSRGAVRSVILQIVFIYKFCQASSSSVSVFDFLTF